MKNVDLRFQCIGRSGYRRIVSPKNAPLELIEFGIVRLRGRESIILPIFGREVAATLIRGSCNVEGDGRKLSMGPRKDVFSQQAWAVYACGLERLKITARASLEVLVSLAPITSRKPLLTLIEPSAVIERTVGEETYERRVRTIIGEDSPAQRLLVGETINEAGKWSSYPPHRHEKDALPHEAKLEEVYYYKLEKPNGFGVQRIYTDDGGINKTYTVRDGDLCVIPRGYHPVAAAPNSRLYYFWTLAGKHRKMRYRVDPHFLE